MREADAMSRVLAYGGEGAKPEPAKPKPAEKPAEKPADKTDGAKSAPEKT